MAVLANVRSLDVVVTSDCNLRCSYCYQNAKGPGVVRWPVLRPALDLLLASRQPEVRLFFVGGEPLLGFPIIQRAVRYVESQRPRRLRVEFDISTNGTLLGPGEAAFLDEHRFSVQLSFDGVRASQEHRGRGTFDVLDRLVQYLAERHPGMFAGRLNVAMTLPSSSIRRLARSVAYLLARGIQDFGISPTLTPEPGWDTSSVAALDRQFASVYRQCLGHYRRTGRVPLRLFRKPDSTSLAAPASDWFCGVSSGEALTLDADGTLVGCVMFAPSYQRFPPTPLGEALATLRIGRIGDRDLASRLSDYAQRVEALGLFNHRGRKHSAYRRCSRCIFRPDCRFCPVCIAHPPAGVDSDRVPDYVCAYNLVSLKYRSRFPRPPTIQDLVTMRDRPPDLVREVLATAPGGLTRPKPYRAGGGR
jgi:sulfatase maturation enzyme AslB (radical SAM superfamily)